MGEKITYDNFPLMSSFNYDHWCGTSGYNTWGYFKSYQSGGYSGYYGHNRNGNFVWLMRLQLPSVINGQTVQKITSISLTVYGQGMAGNNNSNEACIIGRDGFPEGNDTPTGWVNSAKWQSDERKSGAVETWPSASNLTYNFNNLSLKGGETYYIVFFSSNLASTFEYNFKVVGYPSLTVEADVITYGIRYHWFDNNYSGNLQDVSPGQQKLDSQGLESTLINNYNYMVYGWCTTPVNLTGKKRNMSGQKYYFEGDTYSIWDGLNLYPVGGPALDLGDNDILKNYYLLNNTQYALEVPSKSVGDSDSYGVGFWIDNPNIGERSIPYVMQNSKWHMLGGSLKSRIASGDDSYKLGRPGVQQAYYYHFVGRGTEGKLYSSDSTYYEVPIIFIGDTALDLFKTNAEYSWQELRDYYGFTEFRDATIEGSHMLYKAMPSVASLLADEQHPRAVRLTFPVYKINIKTFDWALSNNALYGQVNGIMKRWLVSSSNATIRTCFLPKSEKLLTGIVNESELKSRMKNSSELQSSYNVTQFLKALSSCGSYFASGEGVSSPLPIGTRLRYIPVNKWRQLNQGGTCNFNQFSPMPPSNEYGAVLTIPSFDSENIILHFNQGYNLSNSETIGGINVNVPLRVYWVSQTPYIFYQSGANWLEISNSNYDNIATLLKSFTGWEFNGKSYMSLKDLFTQEAETLCNNYINSGQSVITLKAGDTNGFAYIKEADGKIGQYYIYVKDTDSGASLTRCTPYIKQNDGWLYKSYHNILGIDAKN